jgi:hypothetical protein
MFRSKKISLAGIVSSHGGHNSAGLFRDMALKGS